MKKRNRILTVAMVAAVAIGFMFFTKKKVIETGTAEKELVFQAQAETVAPVLNSSIKREAKLDVIEARNTIETSASSSEKKPAILSLEEVKKIRQVAKGNLASAYTAMAAYQAEWDRYTTDFQAAGWMPLGNTELQIKIGFIEPYFPNRANKELTEGEQPERNSTDVFINQPVHSDNPAGPKFSYSDYLKNVNLADFRKYCRMSCTATENEFEILAVVPLGGNRYDIWTINNRKVLEQVHDGLAAP